MSHKKLHIVLVDHLDGGHHLAFMGLYAKCLIQLGHKVSLLYPEPEQVREWLGPKYSDHVEIFDEFKIDITVKPTSTTFENIKIAYQHWKQSFRAVSAINNKSEIDFVFFNWLDSYLTGFFPALFVDLIFRFRWTGLYLHPRHLRLFPELKRKRPSLSDVDRLLMAGNCFALAVHDRGIISRYSKRLSNKSIVLLPETADLTTPGENSISLAIRGRSIGRHIVGVIGLAKHQGLLAIIRAVPKMDSSRYFFVFAGKENMASFSYSEWQEWQDFKSMKYENCFFYLEHLQEGLEYNSVFNAIDTIFLVYENFTSTSNRLTKSAAFRKLVLAQSRFCIGEDVKDYHLGRTVFDSSQREVIKQINYIADNYEGLVLKARFSEYTLLNSQQILREQFDKICNLYLNENP